MNKTNYIAKYEILDGMGCKVAEADSFDDAMFAAEKYAKAGKSTASVIKTATGKQVWWTR